MSAAACRRSAAVLAILSTAFAACAATFGRPLWWVAAACGVAALLLLLRLHIHRRVVALVSRRLDAPVPDDYVVAEINDESELRELWFVNCVLYGKGALAFEAYAQWWRKYPRAILALKRGGRIAGGITVWPVRGPAFKRLLRGSWALCLDDFYSLHDVRGCRHWYVSGIVVNPDDRSPAVLRALLMRALRTGLEAAKDQFGGSICAVAFSPQGAKLLERFGFDRRRESTPEGFPVYALLNVGPAFVWRMALRAAQSRRRPRSVSAAAA